jgi:hypothetical protein
MNKVLCLALILLLFLSVLTFGAFCLMPVNAESASSTASKDATICSTSMDWNDGGDSRLDFGFDNYSNSVYRFLVQFDLPATLAGKDITSATLRLYGPLPWSGGYPSGETLRVCRVTHDWVEGTGNSAAKTHDGVTWNEYNYTDGLATVTNNWDAPGGDYTLTDSSTVVIPEYPLTWYGLNITVTNIVKGWLNSAYPNFGFLVKLEQESGGYRGGVFDAKESSGGSGIRLEINYTGTTPTSTPTPTSTSTSTPASTPTPTPVSTPTLTPMPVPTATPSPTLAPANGTKNSIPPEALYAAAAAAVAVIVAVVILMLRKRSRRPQPLPPPPPS